MTSGKSGDMATCINCEGENFQKKYSADYMTIMCETCGITWNVGIDMGMNEAKEEPELTQKELDELETENRLKEFDRIIHLLDSDYALLVFVLEYYDVMDYYEGGC